jgi:tetratricopeptide (TPR) repeat protein
MTKPLLRTLGLAFVMLALVACDRLMTAENADKTLQHFSTVNEDGTRPPASAFTYYQFGVNAVARDSLIEALDYFSISIAIDPTYPLGYTWRAYIYRELDRPELAIDDYSTLIQLDPTNAKNYILRARLHRDADDLDKAVADYTSVIDGDLGDISERVKAHVRRGLIYSAQQRYEDAVADFTAAIQLNPQDADAYSMRGAVYRDLGRYSEAVSDLTQAIQLDPQSLQSYVMRGNVYHHLHQDEQAMLDYNHGIELDPTIPSWYFGRGLVYEGWGEEDKAIAEYRHYLELPTQNPRERKQVEERLRELVSGIAIPTPQPTP